MQQVSPSLKRYGVLGICLMRSLYWKIFISFWLATILIIITTAWVTSEIAKSSSAPAREYAFMDSYANAAVATFESGKKEALDKWLKQIGLSRQMTLYLLINTGEVISCETPPKSIQNIANEFSKDNLDDGIIKLSNIIVSHEILSTSGHAYRLAAAAQKPLSLFVAISWTGLSLRLLIATFISGLICYLLSLYLTQPLRSLTIAAKSLATGKLNTRVGPLKGHHKDEIADLSHEFDSMASQLEKLVHAKERLLQDISHELRSPLARLHVAIELGRKKSSGQFENEFERMELECLRLNTLIGEIIEFSRLESSTTPLNLMPVNLKPLLISLIEDANFEFSQERPRVTFIKSPELIAMIDEKLIHRACENVLRNALRYSPIDKGVTVSLTKKKSAIEITFEDSGPGVPNDQLKKIFSPFYRVDTSREKKTGGYGLGLSIAKQAVRLNNGVIVAHNKPEGGLSVTIKLLLAS